MCSELQFLYIIFQAELNEWRKFCCAFPKQMQYKVCYHLCVLFILQIGKITFYLASRMQVSNCAKFAHLLFFNLNKIPNIKPSFFFPHQNSILILSTFKNVGLFHSFHQFSPSCPLNSQYNSMEFWFCNQGYAKCYGFSWRKMRGKWGRVSS